MDRRRARTALSAVASLTAVLAAGLVTSPAVSAPSDPGPRAGSRVPAEPGPPRSDTDGDGLSQNLEARLRASAAGDRVAVIVEGLRAPAAQRHVGPFQTGFDLPIIDGFAATMTAGQVTALARQPGVRRVSLDATVRALDDPGNDDFGSTAAVAETPSGDAALDGSGVGVCVVDTGVDPNHEQLSGRVDGFFDAINGRALPYDDHGHGTHVANIAVGDGTAAPGASPAQAELARGVAPAARLYAAKALDGAGSGSDSQVLAGVQWCRDRGDAVRVISMSLGDTAVSNGDDPLSRAVDNAVAAGDVVVVAAGNSGDEPGTVNAPGVARDAVTVGAVAEWSGSTAQTRDGGIWLAGFSSRGPVVRSSGTADVKPDVVAPGVSVLAADSGTVSGYVSLSGTSMATPFVSGAVALSLEAKPTATPGEVKAALAQTAADRGPAGPDNDWGAGLVDVRAFVDTLAAPTSAADAATVERAVFPTATGTTGTVPDNGFVDIPLVAAESGKPLAATVTITSGEARCIWGCLLVEWSPDLDVQLRAGSTVLATSECPLNGLSCGLGRQEVVTIPSPTAGTTYTLRVYAYSGEPNYGAGGPFRVDVSNGTLSGGGGGEVQNVPPVVNAGADRTVRLPKRGTQATFTLTGSATDSDGAVTAWSWRGPDGAVLSSGSGAGTSLTMTDTRPAGSYTYVLQATDDKGATAQDTVTVRVRR